LVDDAFIYYYNGMSIIRVHERAIKCCVRRLNKQQTLFPGGRNMWCIKNGFVCVCALENNLMLQVQ